MKQRIFKIFADLRFAIFLLLLIATLSIIGTVIEQDQSIEIYKQNYPLSNHVLSWNIILKFGFDHIYKSWCFIFLIIVFGISLLSCTFLQQFPMLKFARRCQFFRTSQQFYKLKILTKLKSSLFGQTLFKLKNKHYSIFQQRNNFYAYKGVIGRIGPVIVHFGMILILIGALGGAFTGFKAQEILIKTETFHIQNILNSGKFTYIPHLAMRINDFWITYSKQTNISQFYSDISLLNITGHEILQKTAFINSPLNYNGIDFYQTDWELIGLRLQNYKSIILQYPLISNLINKEKIWITWIPESQTLKNGFIILINNLQGYCSVYNELGSFLGNLELNEKINSNFFISMIDIISSIGLQIKKDPGIFLIYSGFFILIFSTLMSYISYSQIWMIKKRKKLFIGGNTSRANFEFEIEFYKMVKQDK